MSLQYGFGTLILNPNKSSEGCMIFSLLQDTKPSGSGEEQPFVTLNNARSVYETFETPTPQPGSRILGFEIWDQ